MESNGVRVLFVDDDDAVARAYTRQLSSQGFVVEAASNGREAIERLKASPFDVIVSDISMPEMTGIEFLKAVRAHDLDVPVILMTGGPDMQSALRAIEYGAFRYLTKPVDGKELGETVTRAAKLHAMAKLKHEALELPSKEPRKGLGDRAALEVRFSWGVSLMWMAFQPIVMWREQRVYGYEALLRSDEALMKNPADMLDAAERLGRLHELGRAVRASVAAAAHNAPAGTKLFVNLHAADLTDEQLYANDAPLTKIATRVVLEVTERASLDGVKNIGACVAQLKALGFEVAIDDLGAGYAGLTSFTHLDPNVVKLDMGLVRHVDTDARRQTIIRAMKLLCDDLGMLVVAEGVETTSERDALVSLGCDVLQGYLFGKPEREFKSARF